MIFPPRLSNSFYAHPVDGVAVCLHFIEVPRATQKQFKIPFSKRPKIIKAIKGQLVPDQAGNLQRHLLDVPKKNLTGEVEKSKK